MFNARPSLSQTANSAIMVYKIYTNKYLNKLYNQIAKKLNEKDKEILNIFKTRHYKIWINHNHLEFLYFKILINFVGMSFSSLSNETIKD